MQEAQQRITNREKCRDAWMALMRSVGSANFASGIPKDQAAQQAPGVGGLLVIGRSAVDVQSMMQVLTPTTIKPTPVLAGRVARLAVDYWWTSMKYGSTAFVAADEPESRCIACEIVGSLLQGVLCRQLPSAGQRGPRAAEKPAPGQL